MRSDRLRFSGPFISSTNNSNQFLSPNWRLSEDLGSGGWTAAPPWTNKEPFSMALMTSPEQVTTPSLTAALLPIMGVVFVAFLVIGVAMPVLPLHVHQGLGLSTFVVGLVAGSQFAASLVSRVWAGRHADSRGAKHTVVVGLVAAAAAGLLYLLSLRFVSTPATSVTILLLGRALLGAGESFIVTGAQSWGLTLAGPQNTGKVLAWMGTAMYAAFALGAPAGTALYAGYGVAAIALATTLVPLATLMLVWPLR